MGDIGAIGLTDTAGFARFACWEAPFDTAVDAGRPLGQAGVSAPKFQEVRMVTCEVLDAAQARAALPELSALLRDSVESGASIGFMLPLTEEVVAEYWGKVAADVAAGTRVLLAARLEGRLVGSGQLELATKQNALHRAEVQKVLVHTSLRRQGIGRALMAALDGEARRLGRTLLVLDTRAHDAAERLYVAAGYTFAGRIPDYARSPDGTMDATTLFYRKL
jgi:acetyltransferase